MFLLIDNYDSFTYNLAQALFQVGITPLIVKNDDPALLKLAEAPELSGVCISPGPSNPDNAGLCLEFLKKLPPHIPCLGVCLGHEILGHFAGAQIIIADEPFHGKTSPVSHNGQGLFHDIASPMMVGRYHSLVLDPETVPESLEITAQSERGEIMALCFKDRPWMGVQFHPESILTESGERIFDNFAALITKDKMPEETLPHAEAMKKQTATPISKIIETLAQGRDLSQQEAYEAFARLMEGELSPSQAAAFLLGLRMKGETPVEVSEAVRAILTKAVAVPALEGRYIDIVGTGGDGKFSFNCSTATALTLAGMGYKVLKHGNRSVSSSSGSADVLEKMGVPLDTTPDRIKPILDEQGFVFLFAPHYHPAFRHVMSVRREMGVRTLFNILGPLVNPASPTHSMLGVANENQLNLVAETLARIRPNSLGAVILGAGGYDELTAMGPANIVFVKNGQPQRTIFDPAEYGFKPCEEKELEVSTPDESAKVLKAILSGKGPKAMQDMTALNVGFAIYILEYLRNDPLVAGKENAGSGNFDKTFMTYAMEKAVAAVAAGAGKRFVS